MAARAAAEKPQAWSAGQQRARATRRRVPAWRSPSLTLTPRPGPPRPRASCMGALHRAADCTGEWFATESGHAVRACCTCMVGAPGSTTQCVTAIRSELWGRVREDPAATHQLWYCTARGAMRKTTSGVYMEVVHPAAASSHWPSSRPHRRGRQTVDRGAADRQVRQSGGAVGVPPQGGADGQGGATSSNSSREGVLLRGALARGQHHDGLAPALQPQGIAQGSADNTKATARGEMPEGGALRPAAAAGPPLPPPCRRCRCVALWPDLSLAQPVRLIGRSGVRPVRRARCGVAQPSPGLLVTPNAGIPTAANTHAFGNECVHGVRRQSHFHTSGNLGNPLRHSSPPPMRQAVRHVHSACSVCMCVSASVYTTIAAIVTIISVTSVWSLFATLHRGGMRSP